jgi:hypothetical protein
LTAVNAQRSVERSDLSQPTGDEAMLDVLETLITLGDRDIVPQVDRDAFHGDDGRHTHISSRQFFVYG